MKISVAIASVPERRREVIVLLQKLARMDPLLDVCAVWDMKHQGSWHGHKLAWEAYAPDATHHLTIEDDTDVCADFTAHLINAVTAVDDQIISPYASRASRAKVAWAHKHDVSWFVDKRGASGQAVLMPVPMLKEFLAWERRTCPAEMPYEDSRLYGFMAEHDLLTWNTVPALIEHLQPMNSILGFNNKGKIAAEFLGYEHTDVDFSKVPLNPHIFKYKTGLETYQKWVNPSYKET